MNSEINSQPSTTKATHSNPATDPKWIADEALGIQEILTEEDINQKYHDHISQINAAEGSGVPKDRMARLASILASKNLII